MSSTLKMNSPELTGPFNQNDAINELSRLAQELTGVQLTERHRSMVQSRLQKRLIELNLTDLDAYLTYFKKNSSTESNKLIGLLTTHHTYFFREFAHFEFLLNRALPALLPILRARPDKKLRVWSAACSRGQEAYSLAMFLELHLKKIDPSLSYEILGTDIDPESVETAKNGVYLRDDLKEVPLTLLGSNWAKGTGDIEKYVKAKNSIRIPCQFRSLNLLELKANSSPTENFDVIFCRNVFIYFNADQIKGISQQLMNRLHPQGYLFIGISESFNGLKLPVICPGPSIYQHIQKQEIHTPVQPPAPSKSLTGSLTAVLSSSQLDRPIRVLCVDDSLSILTLMKQMLTIEKGFEIIGTAQNGLEATKKLAELKPDILTLDIHMPEQTGIEYLQKNFRVGHPPVVMVSSVSRDDADLAGKALSLGAADFIEKPALNNLAEKGDELRTKLRCAVMAQKLSLSSELTLDRSFQTQKTIKNPDQKLRIFAFSASQRSKLKTILAEFKGDQPPSVLLLDGAKDMMPQIAELLSKDLGKKVTWQEGPLPSLNPGGLHLLHLETQTQPVIDLSRKSLRVSVLVLGEISKKSGTKLLGFSGAQLVLEDLGKKTGSEGLTEVASDIIPWTSLAYLSTEYLCQDK